MEDEIKNLKDKIEKLEKQKAVKADVVSVSSHQIRTSLSAIKWILKMFTSGDLGKISAEQKGLMEKAYENNERALDLISEMLLTNKAEDVIEKEYLFSKVDMEEMIEDSIFDLSGEAHADKEKIRIVIQNLIENAIKYSNNGGKIFISVTKKNESLEVSIKDTGIGISEEGKKKIFEKFYRDTNAQKKQSIGSGIGLYTAKIIIEKHKGKIWFSSTENEGTTFFFTIPVSTDEK